MSLIHQTLNAAWVGSLWPASRRYFGGIPRAVGLQRELLLGILEKNRDTVFGKAHGFGEIRDIGAFQRRVAPGDYDDFRPYIERIMAGEKNVLTAEAVRLLEPTGGSSSGKPKLIPYTASLQGEFIRGIAPWLTRVYRHYPGAFRDSSYWSVSPAGAEPQFSAGGIPIGFEDDSSYLGWKGRLAARVFAVPRNIRLVDNMARFRYLSALFLLRSQSLSLISVWNPAFLTLLLQTMEDFQEGLCREIYDGSAASRLWENPGQQGPAFPAMPERSRQLSRLFSLPATERYPRIWPGLSLISCWMDGPARFHADFLMRFFPGIPFQPKGLIATEGMVTLPHPLTHNGSLPAFTSHFLEFLTEDGSPRLLHELEPGRTYEVLLTTGGGLYRYRLGDRVTVSGYWRGLPLLQFRGRDKVSDLVGEKLTELHVQEAIETTLQKNHLQATFAMLAPQLAHHGGRYILFLEADSPSQNLLSGVQVSLEGALLKNFHYRYARELHQLQPLQIFLIRHNGLQTYQNRSWEGGQKPGDLKPAFLDCRSGWETYFEGDFCPEWQGEGAKNE